MRLKRLSQSGFAVAEYLVLIIIVLLAIMVFRHYFVRSIAGKQKMVGDTFGFGRQYDPSATIECGWSPVINKWYDEKCFEITRQKCNFGSKIDGNRIDNDQDMRVCEDKLVNNCVTDACKYSAGISQVQAPPQ